MSLRQVCDRCNMVLAADTKMAKIAIEGGKVVTNAELCDGCTHKLEDFLAGRELEVPP